MAIANRNRPWVFALSIVLALVVFFTLAHNSHQPQENILRVPYKKPASFHHDEPEQPYVRPMSPTQEVSLTPSQLPPVIEHENNNEQTARSESSHWVFESSRDGSNYGLSKEQCESSFPKLSVEVDRAVKHYRDNHIMLNDINAFWKKNGLVRAMIFNRKLYVIETKHDGGGYNVRRGLAILGSIHRAIVSSQAPIPNIEFTFSVNDIADPEHMGHPIWVLARHKDTPEQWVMSDFGYWSWELDLVGEYEEIRTKITQTEPSFEEKLPRVFWRGAENSDVRRSLLEVSERFQDSWADIREISWADRTRLKADSNEQALPIPDHCKYKYLVHTEGVSYSGRGKYLQNCNSVTIIHDLEWVENYHAALVTEGLNQNVVQVARDFFDLPTAIDDLMANPEKAKMIAENSASTFRDAYLTPAAQACYWRSLFQGWRSVSFEPELHDRKGNLRGTPYETYILKAFDEHIKSCGWFWKAIGFC